MSQKSVKKTFLETYQPHHEIKKKSIQARSNWKPSERFKGHVAIPGTMRLRWSKKKPRCPKWKHFKAQNLYFPFTTSKKQSEHPSTCEGIFYSSSVKSNASPQTLWLIRGIWCFHVISSGIRYTKLVHNGQAERDVRAQSAGGELWSTERVCWILCQCSTERLRSTQRVSSLTPGWLPKII